MGDKWISLKSSWYLYVLCVLCVVVLALYISSSDNRKDIHRRIEVRKHMREVLVVVAAARTIYKIQPPLESDRAFWEWCSSNLPYDVDNNPLLSESPLGKDPWGQQIRVLANQNIPICLVSCGPNMVWDKMREDDIVVTFVREGEYVAIKNAPLYE